MKIKKWSPQTLLETSGTYWQTFTLHTAVKLDIFSILSNDSLNAKEISKKINGNPRSVKMFLNALAAMELIKKNGDLYTNTDTSSTYLSKESPSYIGFMILHHHHLVASWAELDKSVQTGCHIPRKKTRDDEAQRESFLMGMFNLAMQNAPCLASKINLSNRRQLLDLGGGPGTYAIFFCQENPSLNATIYDLPTTRPFAEKIIEEFRMENRIRFMEGNYLNDPINGQYDVAWLSHILHAESPSNCEKIILKTAQTLKSGGMIIIHDFILNEQEDGPLFPALFALNMLVRTEGGQTYSEKNIAKFLSNAGFKSINRLSFAGPNDSGIMTAISK